MIQMLLNTIRTRRSVSPTVGGSDLLPLDAPQQGCWLSVLHVLECQRHEAEEQERSETVTRPLATGGRLHGGRCLAWATIIIIYSRQAKLPASFLYQLLI